MHEGRFFGPSQGRIALYFAGDCKALALSFVAELLLKATDIGRNPLAYSLVPCFGDRHIRRPVFRGYLISYRADDDAAYIVDILHGAQDYGALLFPPDT